MGPFEIITSPLKLWIAPIGTAFPTLDEDPAVDWTLVGTNGDKNYAEGGVTVAHSKSYTKIRTDGASGPVKSTLTEEDLMFRVNLLDLTLEQYANALNGNIVTTIAAGSGTVGHKRIGLSQNVGRTREFALMARGLSPYNEQLPLQYCVPRCFDSGSAQPIFSKSNGAGLALELTALEDLAATNPEENFGYLLAAHQEALP